MYEEKYVKRGAIYSVGSGEESDSPFTKPGLIISSDGCNENSSNVIIAYVTLKDNNIGIHYGPTKATGKPSYIQCEYLATVNKKRLGRFMGRLSDNEMREVESRLDEVLDMGYVDNTPLYEKEAECEALRLQLEELRTEIALLKKKDQQHEDELLTRDVEIAVAKRMYGKAVAIIASMRAEPDMPERPMGPPKKVVEPKVPEAKVPEKNPTPKKPTPKKADPKPQPQPTGLVDINSATFGMLRSIGLSNGIVLTIINDRPFKRVEDLKKVPGVNNTLYRIIENKVCCIPVPEQPKVEETPVVVETPKVEVEEPKVPEEPSVVKVESEVTKVNVNTASVVELTGIGLNKRSAQEIVSHRNKNGDYTKLEDLLVLKNFGNTCMKRCGHLLEV